MEKEGLWYSVGGFSTPSIVITIQELGWITSALCAKMLVIWIWLAEAMI